MASSRKSITKPKPLGLRKKQPTFSAAPRIAIALSGGLDSVVLLHSICKTYSASKTKPHIYAFHIHHGLQKGADQWLLFCQSFAQQCGVVFDFRLLHIDTEVHAGNIEARARAMRYEALTELCNYYEINDLLLAHHQNDQAETVLLQLLRGAGVAGLSAMPATRSIGKKQKGEASAITLWRPLLQLSRAELEAYAREHALDWVEDPSNRSNQYRRNAIRNQVLPKLEVIQPGATANLARSAELLGEAQQLLDRLAIQDAKGIWEKKTGMLRARPLLDLAKANPASANNLVRYWLKMADLAMPSYERLQAWWLDLQQARSDAKLEWRHDGSYIRLWRGLLQIDAQEEGVGEWVFVPVPVNSKKGGLPADWVASAVKNNLIEWRTRVGAERLQCAASTPRKTLKNLYQENAVPPWQRQAPLLFIDGELIGVAGVGVSYPHLVTKGKRVLPEWRSPNAGFIPKTL